MNTMSVFEKNRYIHLPKFLDLENCRQLTQVLKRESEKSGIFDIQCPKSKAIRDNMTFDKLLVDLLPYFEKETGLKLLPTYAYARFYMPGEELKIHIDREACEVSATLTLGFDGNPWPIFMGKATKKPTETYRLNDSGEVIFLEEASEIVMNVGDVVLYRGCELSHWREKYTQGKWQAQVFLHYVDANGPNAEWKFDKRKNLNLPSATIKTIKDINLTFAVIENVISNDECAETVQYFKQHKGEEAAIFNEYNEMVIQKEVRNVNRFAIPTDRGLGAVMAGIGFNVNHDKWKFNITHANQAEILKYPAGGGRYTGHLDTILTNEEHHMTETRKLTVLTFLNDDYVGGKFFLQVSSQKLYPPQSKGSIIIFPSFLLHGVEDVIEGERYSAVTWLVGPWFK